MVCDRSGPRKPHSRDLQTIENDVRKTKRFNVLVEMQSKVTTNCDNSSGTRVQNTGFWVGTFIKKTTHVFLVWFRILPAVV